MDLKIHSNFLWGFIKECFVPYIKMYIFFLSKQAVTGRSVLADVTRTRLWSLCMCINCFEKVIFFRQWEQHL